MQELLSNVAQLELADLPPMIEQCTVNYVPEVGYMLAVPLWDENLNEEDVQIPNLQLLVGAAVLFFLHFCKIMFYFQFVSNYVAHFKTARCKGWVFSF